MVLGDRVTVKCGVQLWDGPRVANDVFIGPNATFTNDKMLRSKQYQQQVLQTHVARGASIVPERRCCPASPSAAGRWWGGCVVTKECSAGSNCNGKPRTDLRLRGLAAAGSEPARGGRCLGGKRTPRAAIGFGSNLHRLKSVGDLQALYRWPIRRRFSFLPQRYFVVFDVPSKYVRGEHAHRQCQSSWSASKEPWPW